MNCGRSRNYFCIDALFDLLFVLKCSACCMPTLKSAYCKVETKPVCFFFLSKTESLCFKAKYQIFSLSLHFLLAAPLKVKLICTADFREEETSLKIFGYFKCLAETDSDSYCCVVCYICII